MDIREYYDKFSEAYLEHYGPVFQSAVFSRDPKQFAAVMMERAIISQQHSVLDVGCGVGGVMLGLMQNGVLDVTGVTISSRQRELARELDADLNVEVADFAEWDDRGRKYDRIILCESFGYLPRPLEMIAKLAGLLRPGGMIYLKDVVAIDDPDYMQQYGLEAMQSLWGGYAVYTLPEVLCLWGMRRIGGSNNLWRETTCNDWVRFALGESSFSKKHKELLAEAGMKQMPIWGNQMPVKTVDFLFCGNR